jgi:hypothetical protein
MAKIGCEQSQQGSLIRSPRRTREVFAREYLVAQVSRFGCNIRAPPNSSAWNARRCIVS